MKSAARASCPSSGSEPDTPPRPPHSTTLLTFNSAHEYWLLALSINCTCLLCLVSLIFLCGRCSQCFMQLTTLLTLLASTHEHFRRHCVLRYVSHLDIDRIQEKLQAFVLFQMDDCFSFISVVVRKYTNKKHLMEQRFNFAFISRLWSIPAAKPQWQEHGTGVASHRRNACMHVCWHASLCSALFLHFSTVQGSLPREWCHTQQGALPPSVNLIKPHRRAYRPAQCRQPLADTPSPGNSR